MKQKQLSIIEASLSPLFYKDLRDFGQTWQRIEFKDGEVVVNHVPMTDILLPITDEDLARAEIMAKKNGIDF